MKNETSSRKGFLFTTLLILLVIGKGQVTAQTTFTSTTSGGLWNTAATWVGGVVPPAGSHVVIAGPVYLNGSYTVGNLTIQVAGTLYNDTHWTSTLTVNGDLINHGKASNHPTSGYLLFLRINGNVENNGTWAVSQTYLTGNSDQRLKQSQGKVFGGYFNTTDSVGRTILDSDVRFENNSWDMNKSTLVSNGHILTTVNYTLNNGKILSDDLLSLKNTLLNAMILNGNYRMDGKVRIKPDVVFNGTATILDTLMNEFAWDPVLVVQGKIVNQGKIIANPGGYRLNLRLLGDAVNNGVWAPTETRFWSTTDQRISQSEGKAFRGYFATTDTLGKILLDSDVLFENNTWDMSKSTLVTNGHILTTVNYTLNNGKILSDDLLSLKNTLLNAMILNGNYRMDGKVRIKPDVVFIGTATILDTLMNEYAWDPVLVVQGKIVNHGKIIANPRGYSLRLQLMGDAENKGLWAPNETHFISEVDQRISQGAGVAFRGYFATTDTLGKILLDSDVLFENNTWNMSRSTVVTNGHTFSTSGYTLNNGKIQSEDLLRLQNTVLNAMILNGSYRIDGKVKIKPGVVFNGTATILDTLMNEFAWDPVLVVQGKIVNRGKIIANPGGYSLRLQLMGDAENKGLWAPNETHFISEVNQRISQAAGVAFRGYFATSDTLGKILLDSDVLFENNTWDMSKSTLVTNGYTFSTSGYTLNNGKIQSDDLLDLQNTVLNAMILNGNYRMDGKVKIKPDVVFNGTATILDTLMNDWPWNPVLVVQGKIINQGKIIANPRGYSLNLRLLGDAVNNGVWAPSETRFWSTTDQRISQSDGKAFRGYFATTDTLGKILLDSNVRFENNTWDMAKSKIVTGQYSLSTANSQLNNGTILSDGRLELQNTILYAMQLDGNYQLAGRVRFQSDNVLNGKVTVLDTLHNDTYWQPVLTINAELVNEGAMISHPQSGYPFYLNINGNITNKGKWAPAITNFTSKADQTIAQIPGKWFEGKFITTDTLGRIVMASNIALSGNTWELNQSKLLTNGFRLESNQYEFIGGKIVSNDTLYLKNSRFADMTVLGDFFLGGRLMVRSNNLFAGNVTNLDSLHNQQYWSPNLVIQGNLVNEGVLSNLPGSGYQLTLSVSGNIENNKILWPGYIYLTGTGDRTFGGKQANAIKATIYIDNNISLVGDNFLPNLNFTNNPSAFCTVKPGAILTAPATLNSSKLKNYGRITISQDIDNTSAATWNYFAASANTPAKTAVTQLTVDHYGYQLHPTATGTVSSWWRIRNSPGLFSDSLNWLKLTYQEDALNGNMEDSLKVFHSPNAGLTWKRIKSGIAIDKTNNIVTVNKAPSYGHYLLSSSALGITNFQPLVETAEPRFGGNTGQLSMYIFGAGFKNSSTLSLKAGTTVIKADSTWVTDGVGESLQARFNLKNKPLGIYDVVIETPGEKTLTLPAWFTIEKGERSQPWMSLSGRDRFLINRWQTFTINYGNTSNTDALGTILVYIVNDLPGLEVEFPDVNIVMAKGVEALGPDFTRIRDSVDIYYVSDTLSGYENRRMRIYPFYIPYIAAGTSKSTRVRVRLTGTGSLTMDSWMLDPLYETIDYNLKSAEPMPVEVRACITAAAMKAWYGGMVNMGASVIPGLACWSIIDKTVDPIGHVTPESLKPDTWGSWLWKGVSIMGSAVQCGASFVPGLGTAVSLGISLVNTAIDIKDGSDATEGCWRKFRKKSQNKLNSRGVTSFDPNEKAGPQGYTAEHYISKEGNLNYTIFFENKKTAGAPALEVFVKDTLDTGKFDFSTFSFGTITFGDTTLRIQAFAKEFRILVDRYPKKNIIVQVHGKLDTLSGVVSWDFHSLDRITLEFTEDPDLGFLPPNSNSPEGEGNVTFSCKLKQSVSHGDRITNRASIVFDLNAPIQTNLFSNTIDDRAPVSRVSPLPFTTEDSLFTVSWNGSDQGSAISKINIFTSVNDSAFVLWKVADGTGEAVFRGKDGFRYEFFSVAADSLGLTEPFKTNPDASTTIDVKTGNREPLTGQDPFRVFPNPASDRCQVTFAGIPETAYTLALEDVNGRTVLKTGRLQDSPGRQVVEMKLSGIPDGLYFVVLKANERIFRQKLVIHHR